MRTFDATVATDLAPPAVVVVGVLDRDAEAVLLDAFVRAAVVSTDRVVIDVAGMTYMNSSGIANLVLLLREAQARDLQIVVRGLSDHDRHLLEITRLADLVNIEETTEMVPE